MKNTQIKFNYFTIINEQVVGGVTAGNNSVIYTIPNIPGVPEKEQASVGKAFVRAIEGNDVLRKLVANYNLDSGTNEWKQFVDLLSTDPNVGPIVRKNRDLFDRYRISRSTSSGDEPNMEVYDKEFEHQPGKTSFPSFQAHWEKGGFHRTGGSPRDPGPPKRTL